jgi:hypothetical protein
MNPLRPRGADWQRVCDLYRIRPGYWFAPKLYGYGATPVRWQAWALTAAVAAATIAIAWLARTTHMSVLALLLPLVGFLYVAVSKTDGEWRWRWGPKDI